MLVGLQGSGKTTTAGKLANLLRKQGKKPLLVACDVYRPAAIKQLQVVGAQLNIPVFANENSKDVVHIAKQAMSVAYSKLNDVVILDTAGRLQIDEELMNELKNVKASVHPHEILLVVDSMTGQEAVNVATGFNDALGIDGVILTKLDGDTRGGAALSVKKVTGKPIKFVGMGEKLSELEVFHPDRMASRILGMGDILSVIEKAEESFDLDTADLNEDKYDADKKDFMDNIFSFEEKQIREVLVPRTDMVCLDLDDSEEYIFNLIKEEGYTRYPVCGKDKDDLLGFIHIRDLYNQKLIEDKVDLTKILRKITYVSESELTSRVLEKLRKDRVQMAIVVDEYGGTSGIVTVEDILEEIVGEIQDEFDEDEELDIKKLDKDSYIVQGTATITEINKVLNIEIEKDGFDSIGGWMFFMLGMDIEINQSVDFSGYRFKVVEIDKFRVISIKIERIK